MEDHTASEDGAGIARTTESCSDIVDGLKCSYNTLPDLITSPGPDLTSL